MQMVETRCLENLPRTLNISSLHYLLVGGKEVDAATVIVGDVLQTPFGETTVTRVTQIAATGVYHLLISGGTCPC